MAEGQTSYNKFWGGLNESYGMVYKGNVEVTQDLYSKIFESHEDKEVGDYMLDDDISL